MNQSSCSEFMIIKKDAKSSRNTLNNEIEREGRWTRQENMKYLLFLAYNQSKFECKKKRMFRLYKPLSQFIETRSSQQCRSHHRKLIQRFKTPKCIINNLNEYFEKDDIENMRKEKETKLSELYIPQKKTKTPKKESTENEEKTKGRINQNQNNGKIEDQIQHRTSNIEKNKWNCMEQNNSSRIFLANNQMTIVDYQALNWWNQMCLSNYSLLYCSNYSFYIDPSQAQSAYLGRN